MLSPSTFRFLKSLRKNNNKEWFDKNKSAYLTAKDDVGALIEEVISELIKFDKSLAGLTAKDCVFRIYRDVRFSKDKRPYKTNMGASINAGGKKAMMPGYYLHLEPGNSFLAGGLWMPPGEQLKKIRQEIDYNGKDINKVLSNAAFKKYYGSFDPSYKLKTTPKGYPKDHQDIELLKLTSFIVWHPFNDKSVLNKNFVQEIGKGARIMHPMLEFLKVAIS
ncbi:MAG TPA: DUF2461 domain-containing protein [Bacteroidia bacterium]|nr:DUF2461 domain-containing protein [Bacteroidia bacterium]